ncbi:hypothetical protein BGX29_003812 [Mortierella sp. GBA35]|nr:hypothetical protein BGX29_003812 [Mortierella sp. GBA35]
MTFVDEQPKRQPAPQPLQRGSTTFTTYPTSTPGPTRTSGVPRVIPVPTDHYSNNSSFSTTSSHSSPSQRPLLGSTDSSSSPRLDVHGQVVDPFLNVEARERGQGQGGHRGDGGHVSLNLGKGSQSLPSYHTGGIQSISQLVGNNNSNNNNEVDERRCRICLEGEDEDIHHGDHHQQYGNQHHYHNDNDDGETTSESGRLISPCLCKGTSRYIHLGCLEKWRSMSPRKESAFACDTCHYKYSFRRPWAAHILGHKWFLRLTTVFIVILLAYGFSWVGRTLDSRGVWKWKEQFGKRPNGDDDGTGGLRTVMGLDWMDVVWGLLFTTCAGFLVLIVSCCVGMVASMSCCQDNEEDDDSEENTSSCCDQSWSFK